MIGKLINEDIEKMLPESLRDKYKHILETFHKMLKEWEAKDGVNEIRIGHELDKKILDFLIIFIDYFSKNYDNVDLKSWSEFISSFPLEFYYGKTGDEELAVSNVERRTV